MLVLVAARDETVSKLVERAVLETSFLLFVHLFEIILNVWHLVTCVLEIIPVSNHNQSRSQIAHIA